MDMHGRWCPYVEPIAVDSGDYRGSASTLLIISTSLADPSAGSAASAGRSRREPHEARASCTSNATQQRFRSIVFLPEGGNTCVAPTEFSNTPDLFHSICQLLRFLRVQFIRRAGEEGMSAQGITNGPEASALTGAGETDPFVALYSAFTKAEASDAAEETPSERTSPPSASCMRPCAY
jgi:hypothetical protein